MQKFEVLFYDRTDGVEPAKDFIGSLEIKMRAKILRTITIVADNGRDLREPYSKSLGQGILSSERSTAVISQGFYISL